MLFRSRKDAQTIINVGAGNPLTGQPQNLAAVAAAICAMAVLELMPLTDEQEGDNKQGPFKTGSPILLH